MTTTIKISFAVLVTFFYSCNASRCNPYFQFDQIEHYSIAIDENDLWDIEDPERKTKMTGKEKKLVELLTYHSPPSDTVVLKDIEMLGFARKDLAKDKFEEMDRIFCERKHGGVTETTCIAIYRDILVFRRENKIIGTAKICFDCDKSVVAGTNKRTDEFGQSGDYGRLYRILH